MMFARTLIDIQSQLKSLYSGKDMVFSMLTCPNCQMLPLYPIECQRCQQPICEACLEKGNNEWRCSTCKTTAKEVRPIHPFVQKAYDAATFECPQKCGKNDLSLTALMTHCNKVCEFRLVKCPFDGCEKVCNRFTINKHKSQCAAGIPKKCQKCEGELSDSHDCISHLLFRLKNETV